MNYSSETTIEKDARNNSIHNSNVLCKRMMKIVKISNFSIKTNENQYSFLCLLWRPIFFFWNQKFYEYEYGSLFVMFAVFLFAFDWNSKQRLLLVTQQWWYSMALNGLNRQWFFSFFYNIFSRLMVYDTIRVRCYYPSFSIDSSNRCQNTSTNNILIQSFDYYLHSKFWFRVNQRWMCEGNIATNQTKQKQSFGCSQCAFVCGCYIGSLVKIFMFDFPLSKYLRLALDLILTIYV